MFVVEMPLNAAGQGPEMDPELVVEIEWQIWDADFVYLASYTTEEEARYYANLGCL